jgi:KDO2-lipid IV(A) lauroyltransferase
MPKARSAIVDFTVYLAVRFVICILQAMSLRLACKVAEGLAWLAYKIDRRHREVALENLRLAFPGRYTEAELDRIVRAIYRHFCTVVAEIVHIPLKLHLNNWSEHMELAKGDSGRTFTDLLLGGRPLVLVTGHFGNWELSGYVFGLLGYRVFAIARPLDNPYLDAYLRRFREVTGQKILAKKGDFDRIQEVLAGGGILGTLGDQDAGPRGLFVDFFGRPASTHKAIALLSLEHNVPLCVAGAARVGGPLEYCGLIEDVIFPEEYQGKPDAIRAITQRLTTALERLVRQYPEQYFWLHRRWKHQPAKAQRRKVA